MNRFPNLFLVGAPKCGTTSMAYYLSQHPQVFVSRFKEPGYFGSELTTRRRRISEHEYLRLYKGWNEEKYALDATVAYFSSARAPEEIAAVSPDAKIIIMVRNPVDAAYSLYWSNRFALVDELEDFESSLKAEKKRLHEKEMPLEGFNEYRLYSQIYAYTANIRRFMNCFPEEAVRVLVFDDFVGNPAQEVENVFRFLELEPAGHINLEVKNRSKRPRNVRFQRLMAHPPEKILYAFRRLVPSSVRSLIYRHLIELNKIEAPYPPMKPETRKMLEKQFKPQVSELSKLLDRDLDSWARDNN